MQAAAANLTKVTLELGGKSPNIVFASADLDAALTGVMEGIWTNAGQVCVGGSRLLVERAVAEEFVDRLAEATGRLTVGHGLTPGIDVGPMISAPQRSRAESIVARALDAGGRAVTGGTPLDGPGYFMTPTVLTDLPHTSEAVSTEIFGPVLVVDTFESENEAVTAANSSEYGLAAGVWTGNGGQAQRVARRLRAGTVWINTYGVFHPTLPFGGTKRSGFGRELGQAAVEQYTERKTVLEDIALPGTA
jgi:aldehyde dehydrogenase (NAD+)/phenylacetaldehyde dehydrogenase